MEILASLFASPKGITRLCQACNVNMQRMGGLLEPMLAKGLIMIRSVDGQEAYSITDEGLRLYKDWLEVWRRLAL
jgi:predicted transcriptional regulator